jgi:hypothetical protein
LEHVLRTASEWTSGTVEPGLVHCAADYGLTSAVWDATRQDLAAQFTGHGRGDMVVPEFVDMLFEQLAALRRLDDCAGGGPLSQRQARIAFHESVSLIHTGRYTTATGNRLLQHAAGAAQLAGWLSFDAGLAPAAHRYQLLAIRIARAAGDTTTVSNVLGMLSYQHAADGNPRLALRFAHGALEHAARAVPLVQARAWGRLATAHASAGDLDGFRRATEQCRRLIEHRHSDNPPSLYYLNPSKSTPSPAKRSSTSPHTLPADARCCCVKPQICSPRSPRKDPRRATAGPVSCTASTSFAPASVPETPTPPPTGSPRWPTTSPKCSPCAAARY